MKRDPDTHPRRRRPGSSGAFEAPPHTAVCTPQVAAPGSPCDVCTELAELIEIYASAPIGLAMVDCNLRYVRINARLAEINGRPAAAHIGRTFADMIPTLAAEVEALCRRVIATGEPVLDIELSGQTAAQPGITRHWRAGYHPVKAADGTVLGVSAVVEEITAYKRAEAALRVQAERHTAELAARVCERTAQLEAANHELEAFGYSVSHDLRAPLRAIDGFCRILAEDHGGALDAQGREVLQRVMRAAARMNQLIDALLGFARLTRVELRRRPVDLAALAQVIAAELQAADSARQVTVAVEGDLTVDGDPGLLRVVMQNLLGNAWKYTARHETARIEVGVLAPGRGGGDDLRSAIGDTRVFYVRDDGAGFDMAYANHLFGAFRRLHSRAEFDGDGIGLATVQRIVQRHGGRIWAEGAVEQGATFYFTLEGERHHD